MRNAWLVALVLAAPVLADDASPRRKPFTSKDGGFSVVMPANPIRKELSVPTPLGPIELQMYIVEQNGAAYFASYADYPEDYVAKNDPQAMLDGAQSGAIGNVKGELVSDSKIELDGNPGREFEFDFPKEGGPIPGGGGGRARVYLVKNRLYQLQVLGKKEIVDDPSADRYFDSFKLTASKPADDEPSSMRKLKADADAADDDDAKPKAKKKPKADADDDDDDDDDAKPKAKKKPKADADDDDADDDAKPKSKGGDDEEKMEKPEA